MTDILINVVLDRSGSMASIREATTKGFNDFIDEQAKTPGALVSLTTFNTTANLEYSAIPIAGVEKLDHKNYIPDGGTALLDAVMRSIVATESLPALPEKVLFVIITDGQENSSTEVKLDQLREAIKRKLDDGWEFSYLGANVEDFAHEAASMGIPVASSGGYYPTASSTSSTWNAASTATTGMRNGKGFGSTLGTLVDDEGYIKEEKEEEEPVPTP